MSHAHAPSLAAPDSSPSGGTPAATAAAAAAVASPPARELELESAQPSAEQALQQQATVRSAGVVASTTMLSRVLGLCRDVGAAALFGAGWVWDAFVLAYLLPNLFRRLFGEGSLAAAFVPVYTKLREAHGDDGEAAARLVSNALSTLVVFLAALTAVVVALSLALPHGAWAFVFGSAGGGYDAAKLELFLTLLPILMPFVVLVCATALLGAALNVHGNFFVPAFSPVLLNLVWLGGIGVAVWLVPASQPELQCLVVAGAILLGGAVGLGHHLLMIRRALKRSSNSSKPEQPVLVSRIDLKDPALRDVGRRMGPAIIGLGVLQVSVLLDSVIAEIFVAGDGAVSALYFGNRLMQLPLALLGVAMAVAIFPVLARQASRDDHAGLLASLRHGTRITLFLAIPACVGLVVLAGPIVGTIYGWGAFDAHAHARTTAVLVCYSLGLVAASLRMLQTRAFFALGDTRTPTVIAVRLVLWNVVLNLILVHTPLAEAGLALSTSIVGWLGYFWLERKLAVRLPRDVEPPPGRSSSSALGCLVRSSIASAAMAAVALGLAALLVGDAGGWQSLGVVSRVAHLALVIGAGGAVFVAVSLLLRTPEFRHLFNTVLRRRRRGQSTQ